MSELAVTRGDISLDVSGVVPADNAATEAWLTGTVVFDPDRISSTPTVIVGIPGGTFHRRYWDLQPPGRTGYSMAEYLANQGLVFVAMDFLGGGESSRPEDGDFIGLESQADAAHLAFLQLRERLANGVLMPGLPEIPVATFVGIGQSLGGFITMIQQGKFSDYSDVAFFGTSPLLMAGTREQPDWESMSVEGRRAWVMEANARQTGTAELPMYARTPRDSWYRETFHMPGVPEDLFRYDDEQCQTLIPRQSGVDGMIPRFSQPFADKITTPVFLAFGEHDVTVDPRREPTGYPASSDITMVVIPDMAHMHNFADTREQLWLRFLTWLPVAPSGCRAVRAANAGSAR